MAPHRITAARPLPGGDAGRRRVDGVVVRGRGHGDRQRHPRFVQRRRPLRRGRSGRRPRAPAGRRRAPSSSTSAASRRGPGAEPAGVATEIDRVRPVIATLVADGVLVSVDTRWAEVATAAIAAGAHIVNDVSGLADPEMVTRRRDDRDAARHRPHARHAGDDAGRSDLRRRRRRGHRRAARRRRPRPRRRRAIGARRPRHRVRQDRSSTTWPCCGRCRSTSSTRRSSVRRARASSVA